jgi:alcohol dehydrogenase class IV
LGIDAKPRLRETLPTIGVNIAASGRSKHPLVIPTHAEGVMQIISLLANNPRNLRVAEAEAIYRRVF